MSPFLDGPVSLPFRRMVVHPVTVIVTAGGLWGCPVTARLPATSLAPSAEPLARVERSRLGGVLFRFRWPPRATQGLLRRASALKIVLSDTQGLVVVGRSIDRVDDSEVTLPFPDLRPGPYRLSVEAYAAGGGLVASGGAELLVRANEMAAAVLQLRRPVAAPVVSGVSPDHGLPGTTVLVSGSGFGEASRGPVSIHMGSVAIQPSFLVFRSDSQVIFRVPPEATTSPILLTVQGTELLAHPAFTTLASLSVQPLGRPLSPRERSFFLFEARDSGGRVFPGARVPWMVLDWQCVGCPPGDHDVLSVDDRGNIAAEPDLIEGYATVQAGIPPLAVRIPVQVQSGL